MQPIYTASSKYLEYGRGRVLQLTQLLQSADDIITKLTLYKNGEIVGPQSQMMWPQAMNLTDGQIGTIGVFVQEGFPRE